MSLSSKIKYKTNIYFEIKSFRLNETVDWAHKYYFLSFFYIYEEKMHDFKRSFLLIFICKGTYFFSVHSEMMVSDCVSRANPAKIGRSSKTVLKTVNEWTMNFRFLSSVNTERHITDGCVLLIQNMFYLFIHLFGITVLVLCDM